MMMKKQTTDLAIDNDYLLADRNKSKKYLSQNVKQRRREIKADAKKLVADTFANKRFKHPIRITNKGIKEWTNQPHKLYAEKNEMLLDIKSVIFTAEYLGRMSRQPKDDYISYLFSAKVKKTESWIIVRKYDRVNDCVIHSISDIYSILRHLEKKEKDVD